jgi:hypothetical protein
MTHAHDRQSIEAMTKPYQQRIATLPSQNPDDHCVGSPQRGSGVSVAVQLDSEPIVRHNSGAPQSTRLMTRPHWQATKLPS